MTYSVRTVSKFIICIMICVEITYLALQFIAIERPMGEEPNHLPPLKPLNVNRPKGVTFIKKGMERNHSHIRGGKVKSNKGRLSTNVSSYNIRDDISAINKNITTSQLSHVKDSDSKYMKADLARDKNSSISAIRTEFSTKLTSEMTYASCNEISRINLTDAMGRGTTKVAFAGTLNGNPVCVKMVTSSVSDVMTCMKTKQSSSSRCLMLANYKLMKEILLILQLHHPSIIKMVGFCIRGEADTKELNDHGVVMVTELGLKVTPYRLKEMNWTTRLQAAVDILDLLDYLHRSPLGSLRMPDFKQTQFVIVNRRIKLSDLDDVTSDERPCQRDRDCYILGESANVPCTDGVCSGLNYKSNLLLATVELLQPLLAESPPLLHDVTSKLLQDLSYKRLNTEEAKTRIKKIAKLPRRNP